MKRYPAHPFLFGVYPILALYAVNIDQVHPEVVLRPLLYAFLGALALLVIFWRLLKDLQRAAILSTLSLILFFSYGHVYELLKSTSFGRHRVLLPVWVLILCLLTWWVIKRARDPGRINAGLNWVGTILLLIPLVQITAYQFDVSSAQAGFIEELELSSASFGDSPPDIYHILLDEYTRQDVLKQVYSLDNSGFLGQLSEMGFSIAECSQSNYAQTELVLATLLNMNYLKDMQRMMPGLELNKPQLRRLIQDSAVLRAVDRLGYTFVAFETGYPFSEFMTADYYFSPNEYEFDLLSGMNNFEVILMKSTAGLLLYDASRVLPTVLIPDFDHPQTQKRERISYKLDMLERIPLEIPGPKYVFAHILLPHEPFVFGPQGEPVQYPDSLDESAYQKAYGDQVVYLNQRLVPILEGIIEHSENPPVIVLQGDTGPGRVSKGRRMAILNALYLPEEWTKSIYAYISPVNTYRLIFDTFSNGELPLLDDVSYYSTYDEPFAFEVIPNWSGGCDAEE